MLQAAAWWNVAGRRDVLEHPLAGAARVVCLGDSNTYGLYVHREEAYPAILQKLWTDGSERADPAVINLGHPGQPTATRTA
jgi:lysophospholipase L1-like esterase